MPERLIPQLSASEAAMFNRDFLHVEKLIESYRPRDVYEYRRSLDLFTRGSLREAMVTDDLPVLLAASTDVHVREAFGAVPKTWTACFKDGVPFTNFRQQKLLDMLELITDDEAGGTSASGRIPIVPENHGYNEARISENYEVATMATYGITFFLTRQMLINDDKRNLARVPEIMGRAMARTINYRVAQVLEANATTTVSGPVMHDGYNLFETSTSAGHHGNMVSGAYGLSADNLKTQIAGFENQKDPSGVSLKNLGIKPKYLIVPTALEPTAQEITSRSLRITGSDIITSSENVLSYIQVVTIPQLTSDVDWYLAADQNEAPTVEVAYLNGKTDPDVLVRAQDMGNLSDADGQQYKIRHDFVAYPAAWSFMRKVDVTS